MFKRQSLYSNADADAETLTPKFSNGLKETLNKCCFTNAILLTIMWHSYNYCLITIKGTVMGIQRLS